MACDADVSYAASSSHQAGATRASSPLASPLGCHILDGWNSLPEVLLQKAVAQLDAQSRKRARLACWHWYHSITPVTVCELDLLPDLSEWERQLSSMAARGGGTEAAQVYLSTRVSADAARAGLQALSRLTALQSLALLQHLNPPAPALQQPSPPAAPFPPSLPLPTTLTSLELTYPCTPAAACLLPHAASLAALPRLQELTVAGLQLRTVRAWPHSLAGHQRLHTITLDVHSTSPVEFAALGPPLSGLPALKDLRLPRAFTDWDYLLQLVAALPRVTHLQCLLTVSSSSARDLALLEMLPQELALAPAGRRLLPPGSPGNPWLSLALHDNSTATSPDKDSAAKILTALTPNLRTLHLHTPRAALLPFLTRPPGPHALTLSRPSPLIHLTYPPPATPLLRTLTNLHTLHLHLHSPAPSAPSAPFAHLAHSLTSLTLHFYGPSASSAGITGADLVPLVALKELVLSCSDLALPLDQIPPNLATLCACGVTLADPVAAPVPFPGGVTLADPVAAPVPFPGGVTLADPVAAPLAPPRAPSNNCPQNPATQRTVLTTKESAGVHNLVAAATATGSTTAWHLDSSNSSHSSNGSSGDSSSDSSNGSSGDSSNGSSSDSSSGSSSDSSSGSSGDRCSTAALPGLPSLRSLTLIQCTCPRKTLRTLLLASPHLQELVLLRLRVYGSGICSMPHAAHSPPTSVSPEPRWPPSPPSTRTQDVLGLISTPPPPTPEPRWPPSPPSTRTQDVLGPISTPILTPGSPPTPPPTTPETPNTPPMASLCVSAPTTPSLTPTPPPSTPQASGAVSPAVLPAHPVPAPHQPPPSCHAHPVTTPHPASLCPSPPLPGPPAHPPAAPPQPPPVAAAADPLPSPGWPSPLAPQPAMPPSQLPPPAPLPAMPLSPLQPPTPSDSLEGCTPHLTQLCIAEGCCSSDPSGFSPAPFNFFPDSEADLRWLSGLTKLRHLGLSSADLQGGCMEAATRKLLRRACELRMEHVLRAIPPLTHLHKVAIRTPSQEQQPTLAAALKALPLAHPVHSLQFGS